MDDQSPLLWLGVVVFLVAGIVLGVGVLTYMKLNLFLLIDTVEEATFYGVTLGRLAGLMIVLMIALGLYFMRDTLLFISALLVGVAFTIGYETFAPAHWRDVPVIDISDLPSLVMGTLRVTSHAVRIGLGM